MSVVPIVMGYGCSVPAILATRILRSKRDKLITATLTSLIPCSARMTIIFGLVGFFLSMKAAIFIYVFNLLLVGLTGRILSALLPEVSPGLIMEIPRYQLPALAPLAKKTWFRLKEFVFIALPILMAGSVVLQVINHFELAGPINRGLAPFTTGLLGFPAAVGTTLLFGVMRKELALVLLFAALGTNDVLSAMTEVQVFTYAFFVTFYVPCLATYAALGRELGWKSATFVSLGTLLVVSTLTVLLRFAAPPFMG
jgi:ferrous iron transport protein B